MQVTSRKSSSLYIKIGTIVRLTKTKVFVDFGHGEFDYNRYNGQHKHDSYSWENIFPTTDQDKIRVRYQIICWKFSQIRWADYSLETLQKVLKLLEEEKDEKL